MKKFLFVLAGLVPICFIMEIVYHSFAIGTVGQIMIGSAVGLVWGWNSNSVYNLLFNRSVTDSRD